MLASEIEKPIEYVSAVMTCPCCNTKVKLDNNKVRFDYMGGLLSKGNDNLHLEPQEADVLKILLDRWPNITSRQGLFLGLYGARWTETSANEDIIDVYMAKVRKKIRVFGIEIHNTRHRGWHLVKAI